MQATEMLLDPVWGSEAPIPDHRLDSLGFPIPGQGERVQTEASHHLQGPGWAEKEEWWTEPGLGGQDGPASRAVHSRQPTGG